ncbi:STAS domain-containing protein [Halopseudomonas pelagia]|uniref:STAS domain-containing protein n=1 Tax=Halopseudomonas pelagia TaxID=553151 RepID=UPI0003A201D3|nr:STAS domain-containing protein [Halopseudomonas pelagia]
MSAQLKLVEPGHITLEGQLDFVNAMAVRRELQQSLEQVQGAVTLDLSGVSHANSVGLSLILFAARIVTARGDQLRVVNMPEGLQSIARVCELEDWLASVAA